MRERIISAIIAIPILLFFLLQRGIYLHIGMGIVSIIALTEIYNCFNKSGYKPIYHVGFIISALMIYFMDFKLTLILLVISIIYSTGVIILKNDKYSIKDLIITNYGILYTIVFLSFIIHIDRLDNKPFIWLIFIIAFLTDTFAYFSGYLFGKRKLAPKISPKKTIEGSIGGIIGSTFFVLVFFHIINNDIKLIYLLLGIIGSISSQIGDLKASLIKRSVGIKDFGKIMPGHGGVLDRFDSIIFTAPIVYIFLSLIL